MLTRFVISAAAGGLLVACAPDAPPASEAAPDAASPRAYFEQTFSGRWGMDASCAEEGLFTLSPDRLELYERSCDVLALTRDGDRIAARTQCAEEGQPMAENTHILSLVSDGEITVSDGHYEWTRHACGATGAQTQGAH